MLEVFRYTFSRFRGQVIGWSIPLVLWGMLVMSLFETVLRQQKQFEELLKNYPPEFMAFFGNMNEIATPHGFLSLEYFTMLVIVLGIFVVLAGSGLLVADEEKGTLDLLLSYPLSRTAVFIGRVLGFTAALVAVLFIAWLGLIVLLPNSPMKASALELALPYVSLFAVLMVFGMLALALSMWLPSRRLAAMTAGIALIASYLITSLANINTNLEALARLSPLNYYQSGNAIDGLNVTWLLALLALAALFELGAWWSFTRRDIRVGGEGSWALPWRRKPAEARRASS